MKSCNMARWLVAVALVGAIPTDALAVIRVTIRPVTRQITGGSDTAGTLPTAQTQFVPGEAFVVELWAQTTEANGLSSVTVDLTFVNTVVTAQSITPAAMFNTTGLSTGTINNPGGLVDDVGGSHPAASPPCSDQVGVANWARVAIVDMQALANGTSVIQSADTASAIFGTAICNAFGNVLPADIDFGQVTVTVADCFANTDCDDGLFCNGPETCVLNVCQTGAPPTLTDGVVCTDDTCDEVNNVVVHTPNNVLCDNGLFCDGSETCDLTLDCQAGGPVCTATCEHCNEVGATCDLCILDLDFNGVMGTGDFALFASCFGGCYLSTDPCAASNFDGDGGVCVGTGDFSGFVGCFGQICANCANCAGPPPLGAHSQVAAMGVAATIRLVTLATASADEVLSVLPPSDTLFSVDQQFFVEVWATRTDAFTGDGLAAVFVDLLLDSDALVVEDVVSSGSMPTFAGGIVEANRGMVSQLGGCAKLSSPGLGANGTWVRVATLAVRAVAGGSMALMTGPSDEVHGVSIVNELGDLDSYSIDFGATVVHVVRRPAARKVPHQIRKGIGR